MKNNNLNQKIIFCVFVHLFIIKMYIKQIMFINIYKMWKIYVIISFRDVQYNIKNIIKYK